MSFLSLFMYSGYKDKKAQKSSPGASQNTEMTAVNKIRQANFCVLDLLKTRTILNQRTYQRTTCLSAGMSMFDSNL